ncbi:MAG: Fic family protein [Gallionellaceae bacterium]|nr:Fic family protein [Gallionellaceae bacterium]
MSKYQFTESEIYLTGTDIPRNRLGIESPDLLHEVEATLLQQAYTRFITELDSSVRFDGDYFKALHRDTYETIYEWAGRYRTVDMSKGGSLFCRAAHLEQEARRIFRELEQEQYLKQAAGWTTEKFAERLSHYQSELIALHPFYELNGRITRLFFDLIAVYNGYEPIDYSAALAEGPSGLNAYIEASIQCVQRADSSKLQQIVLRGLQKAEPAK